MSNFQRIANESSSGFSSQRATQPYGSDHMPFINANVPAMLAIQMDDVDVPFYHDKSDTVDQLNVQQGPCKKCTPDQWHTWCKETTS